MNILLNNAPDYIVVGGKKIQINTGFRLWLGFILAIKKQDEKQVALTLKDIIYNGEEITEAHVNALLEWINIYTPNEKQTAIKSTTNAVAYDFEIDSNVIFSDLWQYYPELMKKNPNYHEFMAALYGIMSNEKSLLYHRAFARCGDFSKMGKEEKKYWQKERAKYAIKQSQVDIDNIMSGGMVGD